jgi:hypothetical protein
MNQNLSVLKAFGQYKTEPTMDTDLLRYEQARGQQTKSHTSNPTIEQRFPKASMFFQVLPAVVQSRIPNIPSIRQSFSDLRRTRSLHSKSSSTMEATVPETPPPEYASRPGSGIATPYGNISASFDFDDDASITSSAYLIRSLSLPYETSTGISWQHARHGVVAMHQAHQQASAPFDNDEVMATIIRSQYVHSLTLFLRSLPSSLTLAEQMSLHDAMPQDVLSLHDDAPQALIPRNAEPMTKTTPERSLLWRTTAWIVLKLFLLIHILVPYLKHFMRSAAKFESDHQVTRRVFSTSVAMGGGFGRECWRLSQAICQMNDGMIGDVVSEAVGYCAESIGGGIQQGITEARSQQVARRKDRKLTALR